MNHLFFNCTTTSPSGVTGRGKSADRMCAPRRERGNLLSTAYSRVQAPSYFVLYLTIQRSDCLVVSRASRTIQKLRELPSYFRELALPIHGSRDIFPLRLAGCRHLFALSRLVARNRSPRKHLPVQDRPSLHRDHFCHHTHLCFTVLKRGYPVSCRASRPLESLPSIDTT